MSAQLQKVSSLLRSIHGLGFDKKMTTNEISCFLIVACESGKTLGEIGKDAHLDHASVSRVMQMLVNLGRGEQNGYGLLETYSDATDGRLKRVRLTRRGQTLVSKLEKMGGKKS